MAATTRPNGQMVKWIERSGKIAKGRNEINEALAPKPIIELVIGDFAISPQHWQPTNRPASQT